MKVKILLEAGYEEALLGLALSHYDHKVPLLQEDVPFSIGELSIVANTRYFATEEDNVFWNNKKFERMEKLAISFANKKPNPDKEETRNNPAYISAEKKFLEFIGVWVYIQASRDFWSEFDTYRVGVTKQSSSTMHTLSKRFVDETDFEEGTASFMISGFNLCLDDYHNEQSEHYHDVTRLKKNLPEGWLQERIVKLSYKNLQWIIAQRKGHRLKQWGIFCDEILKQVEHRELLEEIEE